MRHYFDLVDVRNNFISAKRLAQAQALLAARAAATACERDSIRKLVEQVPIDVNDDAALWDAKRTVEAMVHPETGFLVPAAFRMCAFMPFNLPIMAGMLLSAPSGMAQIFWQVVNQSYNAGFNYFNRNASMPSSVSSTITSYVIATATAVGATYSLGLIVAHNTNGLTISSNSTAVFLFLRLLPWVAVASAGIVNALAMRFRECADGVTVYDAPAGGVIIGKSVIAGRVGLAKVALSRMLLPLPLLLLPPLLCDVASTLPVLGRAMATSSFIRHCVELSIVATLLQVALPMTMALFPLVSSLPTTSLESKFLGQHDLAGRAITRLYYYHRA